MAREGKEPASRGRSRGAARPGGRVLRDEYDRAAMERTRNDKVLVAAAGLLRTHGGQLTVLDLQRLLHDQGNRIPLPPLIRLLGKKRAQDLVGRPPSDAKGGDGAAHGTRSARLRTELKAHLSDVTMDVLRVRVSWVDAARTPLRGRFDVVAGSAPEIWFSLRADADGLSAAARVQGAKTLSDGTAATASINPRPWRVGRSSGVGECRRRRRGGGGARRVRISLGIEHANGAS